MNNDKHISRVKFIYYSTVGAIAATIPAKLISQVCDLTTVDILGPFYSEGSPIRTLIAYPEEPGPRLIISGIVQGIDCQELSGASVEVWQADNDGCYSRFEVCANGVIEDDFKLRGTIITDNQGQYAYETILPANYGGRPRHIHYKVTAADGTSFITQLYFEGDPYCASDPWCGDADDRIIPLVEEGSAFFGTFDITLDTSMVTALPGDVNQDGQLNILDIVSTVAYILNNEQFNEIQLYAADMNGDGFINILDIVQMVSAILLTPRTDKRPVIDPKLKIGNGRVKYIGIGDLAGIQLEVSGNFKLTNIPHNWNIHHNENTILLFSEDGKSLSNDVLFEYDGEMIIEHNIIADWLNHRATAEIIPMTNTFKLYAPYPNPFNPQTKIRYTLEARSKTSVYVTDILGRNIAQLHTGVQSKGEHSVTWQAKNQASGMYFVHLLSNGVIQSKRVILTK